MSHVSLIANNLTSLTSITCLSPSTISSSEDTLVSLNLHANDLKSLDIPRGYYTSSSSSSSTPVLRNLKDLNISSNSLHEYVPEPQSIRLWDLTPNLIRLDLSANGLRDLRGLKGVPGGLRELNLRSVFGYGRDAWYHFFLGIQRRE